MIWPDGPIMANTMILALAATLLLAFVTVRAVDRRLARMLRRRRHHLIGRVVRRHTRRWGRRAARSLGAALLAVVAGRWIPRRRPASLAAPVPTVVYRHYDAQGRLLYVGITCRGQRRWEEHEEDKPWFRLVARSEVSDPYPTRGAALYAEAIAIRDERPIHNIQRPNPALLRRRAG